MKTVGFVTAISQTWFNLVCDHSPDVESKQKRNDNKNSNITHIKTHTSLFRKVWTNGSEIVKEFKEKLND